MGYRVGQREPLAPLAFARPEAMYKEAQWQNRCEVAAASAMEAAAAAAVAETAAATTTEAAASRGIAVAKPSRQAWNTSSSGSSTHKVDADGGDVALRVRVVGETEEEA